jgi:hypothetical protein
VDGTAATLNAGDSLTGGTGTNVLALYGGGTFRVDQLAAFSGFSAITLNNSGGTASLYLGSQPTSVTHLGSGVEYLYLGSGQTSFDGGSGYNFIFSNTSSNWNSADVINGGTYYCDVVLNSDGDANVTYDLTSNTLLNINHLTGFGDNLTLKINSADMASVSSFYSGGANDHLVTSDPTLDLSHTNISNFSVSSTNTTGTVFTVRDLATAFAIAGGPGQDTIAASGFAFTVDQRATIFATASVETIVDSTGSSGTSQCHGLDPGEHPDRHAYQGGGHQCHRRRTREQHPGADRSRCGILRDRR